MTSAARPAGTRTDQEPGDQAEKEIGISSIFYKLYGLDIRSALPLRSPLSKPSAEALIEMREGDESRFSKFRSAAGPPWVRDPYLFHRMLTDGSDYVRFFNTLEFWISPDGKIILFSPFARAKELFEASICYLQSNVLSFSLLKLGIEHLHATAVVINGQAIAFVADSGLGKSTLAAYLLSEGFPLLTDDLLVLKEESGKIFVQPGAPQVKLFPSTAKRILKHPISKSAVNPRTKKTVYELDEQTFCSSPVPLAAIYILKNPDALPADGGVRIDPLSGKEAVSVLLGETYNLCITDPERLKRHFDYTVDIVNRIPVRMLSYPRNLDKLCSIKKTLTSDLTQEHPTHEINLCPQSVQST